MGITRIGCQDCPGPLRLLDARRDRQHPTIQVRLYECEVCSRRTLTVRLKAELILGGFEKGYIAEASVPIDVSGTWEQFLDTLRRLLAT